jgi:OFA family oxalate/formate antiporter-like MFS transporter
MVFSLSQKAKGISSVLSAIIINIVCGSLYSWSGINGYYISYLKNTDSPNVEIKDGYFFMPIITFTSMCFSPLVALIDEKIGAKYVSLISTIIIIITNIFLYHSTNIFYIYGYMVLYGLFNSMNYMPLIKNCLFYFPNKKGLINGFILFGYGTSSLIYNSIADYLINPSFKQIDSNTGFFDKEISNNVKKYLMFFNLFNGILSVFGFLILFEYKENETDNNNKDDNAVDKNLKENLNEKKENNFSVKDAFYQAIKGIQLYQLWTMSTFLQIVSFTVTNTFRSFGEQCLMPEYFLSNLTKTYSILNGLSRLIWGFLFDKFSFKYLYSFCMITQVFVSSFIFFSVKYQFLFFLLLCLQSIVVSGKISLNITMFTKVYGIKHFSFIYSVSTAIGGCCHLLGPIIIKIVVKSLKDYEKLFIGGGVCCIILEIILINFSEEPFKYKMNGDENENGKELDDI